MTTQQKQTEWRVIGSTVPGASHIRVGTPNQDSILHLRESSFSLPIVLSVSDGHGSDKCFRSDRGSRFAVKKVTQLVSEFLDERRGAFDLTEIESKGKEWLPKEFLRMWQEAVKSEIKAKPFTPEELEKLKQKDGEKALKLIEANPLLAYGATSLTVAVEESFLLYLQLGDGEIISVSEKGEVTRPLPEDSRLFANETTSLCTANPEKDFRFFVQKISDDDRPALILLSTDGYVNSFSDEAGFLRVGTDLLEMLSLNGHDLINESLKSWLEEATQTGSGDDCTVGIIYRADALRKPEVPDKSKTATTTAQAALTEPQNKTTSSENIAPPNQQDFPDDVTVTITVKKDKNRNKATHKVIVNDALKEAPKPAGDNIKST